MVTVNVKLVDGRVVSIVPGAIAAFEDREGVGQPFGLAVTHPVIVLVDGTRYDCERLQCPPDMPQSVAMANAVSNAIIAMAQKQELRSRLVGAN